MVSPDISRCPLQLELEFLQPLAGDSKVLRGAISAFACAAAKQGR
jgi:hypothetical protein